MQMYPVVSFEYEIMFLIDKDYEDPTVQVVCFLSENILNPSELTYSKDTNGIIKNLRQTLMN